MKRMFHGILWIVWLAMLAWGISGVMTRMGMGREPSNYGSYVPWGLWVSSYIFFLGLSEGLFFVAALAYVFRIKELEPVARIALFSAVVVLSCGLLNIWFDLGHMGRAWELFFRPDFSSVMAWMVWAYNIYIVLLLVMLWLEMRCDLARRAKKGGLVGGVSRLLSLGWTCPSTAEEEEACHLKSRKAMTIIGILAMCIAVMAAGGVGALFSTLTSRPYWHTGLFPILFMVGDSVVGLGFLLMMASWFDIVPQKDRHATVLNWMGWLIVITIGLDLLLEWAEFSTPMWYGIGPEGELAREVLFGQYWWAFWVMHIALGSLIPVILLLIRPATRSAYGIAGALIVLTFMTVRINLVIPGQVTPALRGLADAYQDHRLVFDYAPSAFEWSVVAFVAALAMALIYIGWKMLPLRDSDATTA